jgi:hypothetical protein
MRDETFAPCIIVIDALDKCKDENATSTILTALTIFSGRYSPIKFFITSRPVANIMRGFHHTSLVKDTNVLVLHSIPLDILQKDICVYFEDRLTDIARSFDLESWPSSEGLARLVELSRGLFIFAATVAKFVEDKNVSNPKWQLESV